MARYTDAEKRKAVDLYLTEGAEAAADAVGCSRRAIYTWLGMHNVQAKTNDDRRAETEQRHTERREAIREALADKTLEFVTALHPDDPNAKANATVVGILIDKYRLEMGETTGRTESIGLSPIDLELQRTLDEFNRQHTP